MDQSSDPPGRPDALEAEADRAAGNGDIAAARGLLEQVTALQPARTEAWLKLAAMCRAMGDLPHALTAVAGALRVEPLAFIPLLLQASLLDQAGHSEAAGEAYGHALAHAPAEPPPHLARMIAEARRQYAAYVDAAAARLAETVSSTVPALDMEEQRRVGRFSSNALRQTRPYHSEPTHFHYPGLREREYHDRGDFPWLSKLEAATETIRAEFEQVMAAERAELVPYIQYPDEAPLRQWADLNRNRAWTAIHLIQNGAINTVNARHCPATMALLKEVDQPHIPRCGPNAMFSLLAPGTRIPPHTGVANTRLVCHLPLIVPAGCWFRVGAETRSWEVGKAFVFDDTIEHEAMNPSGALRVVFIIDAWHPDLSTAERAAVAAVIAARGPAGEVKGL